MDTIWTFFFRDSVNLRRWGIGSRMMRISSRMLIDDAIQVKTKTSMQLPSVSLVQLVQTYETGVHCQIVAMIVAKRYAVTMPIKP